MAQEMSNRMEYKLKTPGVVARLMGFDGFPAQQSFLTHERSLPEGYLQNAITKHWSLGRHDFLEKHNISNSYAQERPEHRDMYQIWMQSMKTGLLEDHIQQSERHDKNAGEKEVALAKPLATNEKLCHSREFQDAQLVVSSKRNLLLDFLKEPNLLFLKHFYKLQSITTRRITILKPSKPVKKHQPVELNELRNSKPLGNSVSAHQKDENSSLPTRIVILKPSPSQKNDIETVVSSPTSPLRLPQGKDFNGEDEVKWQMQESLTSHQRDKALLTSVPSNGYAGDEISFTSKNGNIREGNLSDSEIVISRSKYSSNYVNRDGSPYSTSSFSIVSYTAESSITREAKKRLSERWAMMALSSSSQDQQEPRRSSITLGEMLALPRINETAKSIEEGNKEGTSVCSSKLYDGERGPGTFLSIHACKDEGRKRSSRKLLRSRSVPSSSTTYEHAGFITKPRSPKLINFLVSKEIAKPKTGKSSLKEKLSNFFFSRRKKPSKEKPGPSSPGGSQVGSQTSSAQLLGTLPEVKQLSVGQSSDDNQNGTNCCVLGESFNLGGPSYQTCSVSGGQDQRTCTLKEPLSPVKAQQPENSSENHDQPSPILEVQFEDGINAEQCSEIVNSACHVSPTRLCHRPEAAARSPLEPVTLTLSLDETSSSEAPPRFLPELSTTTSEEERQWLLFIQALLSATGLDQERPETVYLKWHASEIPLDPALLNKYMDQKEDDQQLNETENRRWRSDHKLLFDCINEALMDMVSCRLLGIHFKRASSDWLNPSEPVTKEVWVRIREWLSGQAKRSCTEREASVLVESEARKHVIGREWEKMMWLEVDDMVKEIEGKILEELVEESLAYQF